MTTTRSGTLFDLEAAAPDGFRYVEDLLTPAEESQLLDVLSGIPFDNFEMRGAVAKRRVAFFGETYEGGTPRPPLPVFLLPVRDRAAAWAGLDPEAFAMALVNEYQPGAPIGWHRDAPQYEVVVGVSLGSACRMRFRKYERPGTPAGPRRTIFEKWLAPRSAYVLSGAARDAYEHHIPAVGELRYSITFRTRRHRGTATRRAAGHGSAA